MTNYKGAFNGYQLVGSESNYQVFYNPKKHTIIKLFKDGNYSKEKLHPNETVWGFDK